MIGICLHASFRQTKIDIFSDITKSISRTRARCSAAFRLSPLFCSCAVLWRGMGMSFMSYEALFRASGGCVEAHQS